MTKEWTASLVHEPEMQSVIMTVKSIDPNVFTDLNVSKREYLSDVQAVAFHMEPTE